MEKKKLSRKKVVLLSLLFVVMVIGIYFLADSCALNNFDITVIYKNVNGDLGLNDYVAKVKFKDSYSFSFIVPEGYDHTKITAQLITMDGNNIAVDIDYKMELLDPEIEVDEEHLYSVDRKFTYTLDSVNRPLKFVIQMGDVQKKQFDITLDGVNAKHYSVVKVKYNPDEYLTTLNSDNCEEFINTESGSISTTYEKSFKDNKVSLDYGSCIALVSNAPDSELLDCFYGDTTYFDYTNQTQVNSQLVSYNIAKRGNMYYTYEAVGQVYKKIYFIGDIKEDISLSKNLPGYKEEKGFQFEKKPNTFYLFAPLYSLNSQTFTYEIYSTTESCWARDDRNQVVKTDYIETINEDESHSIINLGLVNPNSQYKRKYDIFNLYIGKDKANDILLDEDYKATLLDDIYIKVKSDEELNGILNMLLIAEEKQIIRDDLKNYDLIVPKLSFDVLSSGGNYYAKINYDIIEDFIVQRPMELGGQIIDYSIGNCILYPEYDYKKSISETAEASEYFSISVSIAFPDGVEYDGYNLAPYIILRDGTKDYGLLDYHKYKYPSDTMSGFKGRIGILSRFRKDKFISVNNFVDNLYLELYGPEYNGIGQPQISTINLLDTNGLYYSKSFNNYDDLDDNDNTDNIISEIPVYSKINLSVNYAYSLVCAVSPTANLSNLQANKISCDNITFPADPSQAIYITNDFKFGEDKNLEKLFYADTDVVSQIGGDRNFYYVSTIEDEYFNFDIYFIQKDLEGNDLEPIKISKTTILRDITGKVMQMEINGIQYDISIKYLIPIYEKPPQGVYYLMRG